MCNMSHSCVAWLIHMGDMSNLLCKTVCLDVFGCNNVINFARPESNLLCNALQRTATHCNALQCTATHCIALYHTATNCNTDPESQTAMGWLRWVGVLKW